MQYKSLINLKDDSLNTAINMSCTPSTYQSPSHCRSKLSSNSVIMIKLLYHVANYKKDELAIMYNIKPLTIYKIVKNQTHKNIPLNFMTKIPEEFHEMTNNLYRDYKIKGQR